MTVVSDAGPLRYLAILDLAGILAHYFDKVLVPPAVVRDLPYASS